MKPLIVGDPAQFAIESGISQVLTPQSQLAIGYFTIHLGGHRYGVYASDATLLGCSFNAIQTRVSQRGLHTAPFCKLSTALQLIDAYRAANFVDERQEEQFFGLSCSGFKDVVVANGIIFAPDGDAAFDDDSHILQFDCDNYVRLIAFKNLSSGVDSLETIVEKYIVANEFYEILSRWAEGFVLERNRLLLLG